MRLKVWLSVSSMVIRFVSASCILVENIFSKTSTLAIRMNLCAGITSSPMTNQTSALSSRRNWLAKFADNVSEVGGGGGGGDGLSKKVKFGSGRHVQFPSLST